MSKEKSDSLQAIKDFSAGWIGGMAQVLTGQPFDTIKVRLQTQTVAEGPLQCLTRTLKNEGAAGLYKGTLTPLLGVGLCVSIQFVTYEGVKRYFRELNNSQNLHSSQLFIAGALSGTANSFVAGPIEHIRIRLQIQDQANKTFKGPVDVASKLFKSHGLKGIFHGQLITMIREFQGYGAYFMAYEYMAQKARSESATKSLTAYQVISYGALAGYAFWLPSFPIDVVKSKLQADSLSNPKYSGAIDCAVKTFREGGVRAFYKGFLPCLLRAAPVNAATFVAFEWAMKLLN